LANIANNW